MPIISVVLPTAGSMTGGTAMTERAMRACMIIDVHIRCRFSQDAIATVLHGVPKRTASKETSVEDADIMGSISK